MDAPISSSDERDAARLAVLCIDTSLSAGDMTLYRLEPEGRAFERERLIEYLQGLAKPIKIDAERATEGRILLRIAPTKPYKIGPDVDPSTPRDIGEGLGRHYGVDESALIVVKGEDGERLTMRLAGLSLWDQSYRVHVDYVTCGDPDEAARALGAVALCRVG